jgi:hypothetical protein
MVTAPVIEAFEAKPTSAEALGLERPSARALGSGERRGASLVDEHGRAQKL